MIGLKMIVSDNLITQAQQIRSERDTKFGNIFEEVDTDMRWVGEVGEICFNYWTQKNTALPIKWILDKVQGNADFLVGENRIGMKTVKRKVAVRLEYTAQITARHANEPVDHFFFASYEFPKRVLWLLGGIEKQKFLRESRYYSAGEKVHENYTIRNGHEIYNIEISKLTPPGEWLKSLT